MVDPATLGDAVPFTVRFVARNAFEDVGGDAPVRLAASSVQAMGERRDEARETPRNPWWYRWAGSGVVYPRRAWQPPLGQGDPRRRRGVDASTSTFRGLVTARRSVAFAGSTRRQRRPHCVHAKRFSGSLGELHHALGGAHDGARRGVIVGYGVQDGIVTRIRDPRVGRQRSVRRAHHLTAFVTCLAVGA